MEIPLFPLPNLVLFPQIAVRMKIFEDRYNLMINRCTDKKEVFGFVWLVQGLRKSWKARSIASASPRESSRWIVFRTAA